MMETHRPGECCMTETHRPGEVCMETHRRDEGCREGPS